MKSNHSTMMIFAGVSFWVATAFCLGYGVGISVQQEKDLTILDNYALVSLLKSENSKLYISSPREDGDITESCYLSTSPLSREQLYSVPLCRSERTGVVLVEPIVKQHKTECYVLSVGNFVISGDPQLAEEVANMINDRHSVMRTR